MTANLFPSVPQLIAARNYLGWSQEDLAKKAGVGVATLRRLEKSSGLSATLDAPVAAYDPKSSTLIQLLRTLNAAGVEFGVDGSVEVVRFDEDARATAAQSRQQKTD